MTTPAFPVNAQKARVWFYWWGQDGGGSGRKTTFRPTATDLTDMAAFGYIETETKVVTPDRVTALVYADLICTDDEDLTPFLWEVTREGQTPKMIAVSVNAPEMDVGGVTMRAVPLTDAATPDPPPEPVATYYDSQQTDAVVTNGINAHDISPTAHQDIRALIIGEGGATGTAGGVLSGTYPNPGFAQDMATQAELEAAEERLAALTQWAATPDALIVGAITRDANEAAVSAGVVWPDGTPGTYTATTLSSSFPGAVDAYTITYGSTTYTQPAVTRDAAGAVTQRPAITVS